MKTEQFYSDLKPIYSLFEITDLKNFVNVPEDWFIVLTDVIGSTKAIETGRYKDVNIVAASFLTALLNLTQEYQIPFLFGGDGATCLIPPSLLQKAKYAMSQTQILSQEQFQLKSRVAIIPVRDLYLQKLDLKIAKLKIAEKYEQAILVGSGVEKAEYFMKDMTVTKYDLKPELQTDIDVDYSGLTCRWQDIVSPKEEIMALIIKANKATFMDEIKVYKEVLLKIKDVLGEEELYKPINASSLFLTLQTIRLLPETKVRTFKKSIIKKASYFIKILLQNFFGKFLAISGFKFGGYNPVQHKQNMVITSDYKKFDGSLKMIIAVNSQEKKQLVKELDKLEKDKKIIYGTHYTTRSLITCLVFAKTNQEVHFIDAADGGYALAAKEFKSKII